MVKVNKMIGRAIEIAKNEGILVLMKKSYRFVKGVVLKQYHGFVVPYAVWKIKKVNFGSVEELVDFSFNCFHELIRPMQIREEIIELLKILSKRKPKVILEIRTANGGTLFLFSRVVSEDATIISVDLPGGRFGSGYPDWKVPLYKAFALPTQDIHLIRANSHDPETLETIKEILNGRKVDFLFIDGDHSYEGVKADFKMYSPLVNNGGLIAFHDIVPGPEENVGGVPRFWEGIKKKYKYREIVKRFDQGGWGIGILEV